jgi:hypothetical protein
MIVVGMVSSYHEGRLVRGAIETLLEVELDLLYVFEGPAGEPLDAAALSASPPSELDLLIPAPPRTLIHRGRWRTDARKRDQMLQRARADVARRSGRSGSPWWCVVVDADELLGNGRWLRDRLAAIEAQDLHDGGAPTSHLPLRLVERDGSISFITARIFRGDLVRSIDYSSSVITNMAGVREGWGNYAELSRLWQEAWLRAIDDGKMLALPPLPGETYIVHRSQLRHPARRGLRMSDQEAVEFARAQALEAAGG